MIFLFTGVPGASKTIGAIKFINEDDQFEGRPIFYHNINEVKKTNDKGVEVLREKWTEIDNDQALKWFDLPRGSVVVFDECQDLFPVNTSRKGAPPEALSMFAKHRHYGIDIFLITQEPRNCDAFVRRLVGLHRHHARHFGSHKLKVLEWQNRCCENIHDYHEKQEALITQTSIDKKYFGVYHSAEVHTHKSRLPWSRLVMLFCIFLCIPGLMFYVWSTFSDGTSSADIESPPQFDESVNIGANTSYTDISDQDEWLDTHTPRIDGLDFTAPVYDEVREVRQYPIPHCLYNHVTDVCQCYSQQATKMHIKKEMCMDLITNGFFDYAQDKKNRSSRQLMQTGRSPDVSIGRPIRSSY